VRFVTKVKETVSMAFMLLTLLAVIVSIVGRFVFNHPFMWSEELPSIFILWSVFLLVGVNYNGNNFLKIDVIDLVLKKSSGKMNKFLDWFRDAVLLICAIVIICFGIVAFKTNFTNEVMSINVSIALTNYLPAIIGAISLVYYMLLRYINRQ
jgi:TRAP-type C4-dicarboxylate transport system permease small subunit